MSQRKVKEKRKDFDNRVEKLHEELTALSRKYKIDIVPTLQFDPRGIVPVLNYVDRKDQYEHKTKEAEKAENDTSKPRLKT